MVYKLYSYFTEEEKERQRKAIGNKTKSNSTVWSMILYHFKKKPTANSSASLCNFMGGYKHKEVWKAIVSYQMSII